MDHGSPNEDLFTHRSAPRAMREAVEALCAETGRTLAEMEQQPLGQLVRLAQHHYGTDLPFFWQNWLDWQKDDGPQPMGEL